MRRTLLAALCALLLASPAARADEGLFTRLASFLKPRPKLPIGLAVKLGARELDVGDDGVVRIKEGARSFETRLTAEESLAIATAVKSIDRSGFTGDVSDRGDAVPRFQIVTYEVFRQYLVRGSVGSYDGHADIETLVSTLSSVVERATKAADPVAARPARTRGMADLLDARTAEARDRARGDEARDR